MPANLENSAVATELVDEGHAVKGESQKYLWQIHADVWQNQYNIVKWMASN